MPIYRQATPGPSRNAHPYAREEAIGYPRHLSPQAMILQAWPDQDQEPEEPARIQRRGRPSRNNATREQRTQKVYRQIREAIHDQYVIPEIYHDLERHNNPDMMMRAVANITIAKETAIIQEFRAYYTIGYGLDIALENQSPSDETFPTWTEIGVQYSLTSRQIKIGRRIYQLFRLWPDALDRIRGIQVIDIEKMTDEEYQGNVLRLIMSEPANQYSAVPMI
jgi:hypothetical protein